jgi:lipopolysaccharide transport system ATP-binding protein
MSTAIEFRNVSKFFQMDRERSRSFQELFLTFVRGSGRKSQTANGTHPKRNTNEFWALRDVSFEIERGDSVGLIGTNGAGKSTTLKLISRIIQPTSGQIIVNGRVTALLELGAGFHPELSGRDNIFLNGAVMGLSRRQVNQRIDQIIDFAEIEDFIDVPVKDYSSGMFARLGFSVAVHLDPDILLVDEVLSVGDAAFQQKCNERMAQLRQNGITILFVSHSADAVLRTCAKALWLDHGTLRAAGEAKTVTDAYHEQVVERATRRYQHVDGSDRGGSGKARIVRFELLNSLSEPIVTTQTNQTLIFRFHYHARTRIANPLFGLAVHHVLTNAHMAGPNNTMAPFDIPFIEGDGYVDYRIDRVPLLPGDYNITAVIYDYEGIHPHDIWINALRLRVVSGGTREKYGLIALEGNWAHHVGAAGAPIASVSDQSDHAVAVSMQTHPARTAPTSAP